MFTALCKPILCPQNYSDFFLIKIKKMNVLLNVQIEVDEKQIIKIAGMRLDDKHFVANIKFAKSSNEI